MRKWSSVNLKTFSTHLYANAITAEQTVKKPDIAMTYAVMSVNVAIMTVSVFVFVVLR